MFKHILVPTDGTQFSQDAVRRAVSFAKDTGASITAFYAQRGFPDPARYAGSEISYLHPWEGEANEEKRVAEILGFVESLCQEAGVKCDKLTRTSDIIYEAIIEAANSSGCDLIFMASHGRRGLSALLLGSETHKVLTHTKIPVLVHR
jgi:nucleotide-binding universal stress UspA family protein